MSQSTATYSTARSEAAYLAAQDVIAGGVNSGARGPGAGWVPGPPVVEHGKGAELWTVTPKGTIAAQATATLA